jgi:sec-independent protein translocase protein TatA
MGGDAKMLRNGLEPWHLLVVLTVMVLLFGSKRLPDLARSVGKSLRILKTETAQLRNDGATATAASSTTAPLAPESSSQTAERGTDHLPER